MRYLAPLALCLGLLGVDAFAQGIVLERIVVDPPRRTPRPQRRWPIQLKEHRVEIRIEDQAARTEVTQVFHNPNAWQMEGIYLFPLPENASVSRFTMRMGGKDITGELLDARRASEIYRSIVYERRDPGLLEYAGRRLLRARLFPIPARGDTRITLRFEQMLEPVGGVIEMVYPLRSDKFSRAPVRVAGSIDVRAAGGVATLYSTSHKLDVVRKSKNHVVASFEEAASRADRDLRLLYSRGDQRVGFSLATHKPVGEDGTFLMLLSPNSAFVKGNALPKDIVFVLDTSGSMGDRGGRKLAQAKAALGYALGRLGPRDRFNVVPFATEARPWRESVVPATPEHVAAAVARLEKLEATGGTAIHDALVAALRLERVSGRVPIILFLTDGEPTIGPTDPEVILRAVAEANGVEARLFVFGVGDDVNATLLTRLAEKNRGTGHFVAEGENIEVKVSALFDKVAAPVLTDVTLTIEGLEAYDLYPRRLGDLFKGQQVSLFGRYRKPGPRAVKLKGRLGERTVTFVYEGTFGDDAGRAYLPRLWAVRKVGFLLDEIRHHGEQRELVDEIRRLGRRHGIVTPYTSFLVVEEREMLRRRFGRPAPGAPAAPGLAAGLRALDETEGEAKSAREALDSGKQSGAKAVTAARFASKLKENGDDQAQVGVRRVDGKTFRYEKGFWVDLAVDARQGSLPVEEVRYLSDAWSALLEDPQLARYLSLGPNVRFEYRGKLYVVRDDG